MELTAVLRALAPIPGVLMLGKYTLTPKDVAVRLRVSTSYIDMLAARGKLPHLSTRLDDFTAMRT